MKFVFFILSVLFGMVAFAVVDGNSGGGGADKKIASQKKIRETLEAIWKSHPRGLYMAFQHVHSNISEIKNKNQRLILSRMYDEKGNPDGAWNTYPVFKVINKVRLDIRDNDACYFQGRPVAAAVVEDRLGDIRSRVWTDLRSQTDIGGAFDDAPYAKICFSTKVLHGLSEVGLLESLRAYSAHELAHLFGASEKEARSVQRLFERKIDLLELDLIRYDLQGVAWNIYVDIGPLQTDVSNHKDVRGICTLLGQLTSLAYQQTRLMLNDSSKTYVKPQRNKLLGNDEYLFSGRLYTQAYQMLSFCGPVVVQRDDGLNSAGLDLRPWGDYPPVAENDRGQLLRRLMTLATDQLRFMKSIGMEIKAKN